ncbi:MAG: hypothetical protein J5524_01125 [Bacteroidaceae bacterium]|nr:hypothetical protein [Bacteroidaceae bacterium]
MKKSLTYLLTLLSFIFSTTLRAEVLIDNPGPVTEFSADKKYVIQTNGQDGSTHWMFDAGSNIAADNSMNMIRPDDKYLWTISPNGDKFTVQNAATKRYISIDGSSNGGSTSTKTTLTTLYIETSEGRCAFKNEKGQYIDMSYSGVGPSTWSGGIAGSRVLIIYEVNLDVSEEDILMEELLSRVKLYEIYLPDYGDETIDRGTDIGQYNASDELYNTFINAVKQAWDIVNEEVEIPSVEVMRALVETIDKSYDDIMATLVKLTIADGNYRIVSAMEWTKTIRTDTGEVDSDGNPVYIETTLHPTKAMYATLDEMKAMWADIDSTDCRFLWKLTNNPGTGFIQMMNIATDGIIDNCSKSSQAMLSTTSTTEMYFQFLGYTDDRKVKVAMRPSSGGNFTFLHANGHGGGTGNKNNIVGWEASAGATQWILEAVSDEEVQKLVDEYAPYKNHELLVSKYQQLIEKADSLVSVAQDETRTELITDASQLSCPFGQNDLYPNNKDGGDISALIDGDPTSYFHTAFGGGNLEPGSHWLFATFDQPVGGELQLTLTRRNSNNDHVSKMDVYGGTDKEGAPESFTLLAQVSFPYNKGGETVNSAKFTVEGAYPVYKYVVTETAPTSYNRGYFHMAEFNMLQISINENSQLKGMAEIGTTLVNELAAAKEMDVDELEISDYDNLKSAYDAAMAIYVDPTLLRDIIKKNKNATELVAIGTDPGFWSAESSAGSFDILLKEAIDYDKAGIYTQAQTDAYIQQIQSGVSDIMSSANPVQEGKWYAIRFADEAMYDKYGWQKGNVVNTKLGDLYDNYLAAANVETEGGETLVMSSMDEITRGQALRFVSDQIIDDMEQVAFRFVALGDSAYILQHKSGLYVNGAASGSSLSLGLTPALFDVNAVGLGKVLIHARNLKGSEYGSNPVYLHAQNAGHSLVTWTATEISSNSALFITEIEENELSSLDISEGVQEAVKPNSMRIWCYPVGFSVTDGILYEFKGAYQKDDAWHYAFNEVEAAKPGQPVLYVNGDIQSFDKDANDEYETLTITSSEIATSPLTENGIYGTYTYQWVNPGAVVVYGGAIASWGNTLVEAMGEENTDCTRDVSANTGYIAPEESVIAEGEYDLVFTIEGDATSIKSLNSALSEGDGEVYDLSGRKVQGARGKRIAQCSTLNGLKKGVYIIGGKKILK